MSFSFTGAPILGGGSQQQPPKPAFSMSFPSASTTQTLGAPVMQPQVQPSGASFATHPFQYIQECFDVNSPNYRFRYFFYNNVPGGIVSNAITRPPYISDRLWKQVMDDNPDPQNMVPVLSNGFADLTSRRQWQDDNQSAQKSKLAELESRISSLLTRQDLDVTTQIQVIQKQQLKLTLRILQLMRQVETMKRAGTKISPQEQQLLGRLQVLAQKMQSPPLATNCVHNLQVQVQSLIEPGRLDPLATCRSCNIVDEESLATLHSVLVQQQKGIASLIESLNATTRDLDIVKYGLAPVTLHS